MNKQNLKGWKHTPDAIRKMSENRKGLTANEKNGRWVGDKVSYPALHSWIRKHYEKPIYCEKCNINPGQNILGRTKLQWANKTGIYKRDRNNWICLCQKCHINFDRSWLKSIKRKNCTSQYKGVCFDKSRNKWISQLFRAGKTIFQKRFNTENEANNAYLLIKEQYIYEK